jgi:hypothetical protein
MDQISMNRKIPSRMREALMTGTILLLAVFANSMINYTYGQNQSMSAPPNKPQNTTITRDSNSVYSIPSTFVKVDRFNANYTIAGEISSINASRDLITSTVVDVRVSRSNSSLSIAPQPGLPNPFVNTDTINQKITNETQSAITAASVTNPTERNVEIKCTFGMILADYKCR